MLLRDTVKVSSLHQSVCVGVCACMVPDLVYYYNIFHIFLCLCNISELNKTMNLPR